MSGYGRQDQPRRFAVCISGAGNSGFGPLAPHVRSMHSSLAETHDGLLKCGSGSCMIQWETTLIAAAGGNSHLESDLGSPRSARSEFIDSTGSAQWDERW